VAQNEQLLAESEPLAATDWRRARAAVLRIPVNSYRLQLSAGFDLAAAADVCTYLDRLGITDCYTSPYFMAGRQSASGYDVCDHTRIQPELGGEDAFARFAAALRDARLGHIIDVVPNHMGLDETRNAWWRDVLTRGRESPYARCFDIDWDPAKAELRHRLLLPILDKPYGAALEAGDIRLVRADDGWFVAYADHELPLAPGTLDATRDPATLTPGELHDLLERQVYRLAHWRTASDEINYRRFFDVGGLAGVRMEDDVVFSAAHARLAALIGDGVVTSLRIDHPDGLAHPRSYLRALQELARAQRAPGIHVVAEKILTASDRLPDDWLVHGTTGYDLLAKVNALFVSGPGRAALCDLYASLRDGPISWIDEAHAARKFIMRTTLASEVQMLAHMLNRISERSPASRDFTLNSLRRALIEFLAAFDVYRTYLEDDGASSQDLERIQAAAGWARRRSPTLEPSIFRFIVSVLVPSGMAASMGYPAAGDVDVAERRRFRQRLQQFSGSVFAKGIEDTAFYRYHPVLSLNEVGSDPLRVGAPLQDFHRANQWRADQAPFGLLTTATHDTKLGEDARARLNALSEMPDDWAHLVRQWRRRLRNYRVRSGTEWMPDPNDEYRFFQALAGTWPIDTVPRDETTYEEDAGPRLAIATAEFERRLTDYMLKSVKEAKLHTSWINPNAEYERSVSVLVRTALSGPAAEQMRDDANRFLVSVARVGAVNSLSQLVLKLTSPGVADVYQGSELWDFNLVDPDNRRPVDFPARQAWLADLEPLFAQAQTSDPAAIAGVRALLDDWPSGRIKLYVTAALLRLRRRHAELFLEGEYLPLYLSGDPEARIAAFVRRRAASGALVIVPRLIAPLMEDGYWPLSVRAWGDLQLTAGAVPPRSPLHNALTGERLTSATTAGESRVLRIAELLSECPVGIWTWNLSQ
jgi:malto-oligosyltrehalose synthase